MSMKKIYIPALSVLILPALQGCIGLAVGGTKAAVNQVTLTDNLPAAERGDPVAQYKVGKVYETHDMVQATQWLCRSGQKDYVPAQVLLRILGRDAGADDYLAKPFDPRELLACSVRSNRIAIDRHLPTIRSVGYMFVVHRSSA
jgi:TPR repeat protein